MRKFIIIFSCLLFAYEQMQAQTCYLKQYIVTEQGKTDTTFYIYDDKTNLLEERKYPIYEGGHYVYTYSYYDGVLYTVYDGMFYHNYSYNDKQQISRVIDTDGGVSNFFQTYIYDNENRLVKIIHYETQYMEDTIISMFYNYYYDGDKLIKREDFENYPDTNSAPSSITTYEYDTHKNPGYNPIYASLTEKYMVTKSLYYGNDGNLFDEYCFTRTCTYNKQGYPVNCTVSYLDGTEKATEVYTYKCK